MISLFDKDNTNFTGNGNVVLTPTEGKIRMVAGGSYDLTMKHVMDPEGKWRHIIPGAIIRAPVPEEEIENAFAGLDVDVYKVTTAADLREGPTAPSTINYPAWSEVTAASGGYSVGSKVTFGNKNYKCTYMDSGSIEARVIPSYSSWWTEIPRTNPGSPALVTLPVGTDLYFVQDVDSTWYKMSTYYGITGYVEKSKLTYDRHLTPSETKPRIITEQLLRITNATVDTKSRTVSVTAEHVSNDLTGVIVRDVSISQASPALALTRITDSFMIPYQGTIATNLDSENNGTYTGDIKGKNGTYCLLDPDKGIVSTFNAALKRDNWDLFILEKTNTNRGFQLRRRKNILGVNWSRKSDGLINRVVPVAKHEGGEDMYLPEVWIDSPRISEYPVIRMEMLAMKEQVGKDKGTGDGSTWTEEELQEEMRTRAGERFSVDKADLIITEVTVDFEMQGVTEEYPELRKLEHVLLYDTVTVIEDDIGLDTALTVTELEWDIIKEKVTALKLSNAEEKGGKNVSGYNVQAKSIGWSKLTDEVQGDILSQVKDIIPEYADPDAPRPATVEVIDGNPTLSWGNRSIVGTVQGTAMHVTMPSDPTFNPNNLSEAASDPTDNNYTMEIGSTSYKLKFSRVWNYIKGKISSVLGLTATAYGGKASTAGDADTVNGKTVQTNVPANAVFTDTVTEVVDALNSTSTTKALSAKQGKALEDKKLNFATLPITSTAPTNANDNTLNGMWFVNAVNCANLPVSTNGVYFQLIMMGCIQIAAQYGNAGIVRTYIRNYANSQWYAWRRIERETFDMVYGVEIAENTNLNTLTTPGNYWSGNSTRTATLTNCPITGQGFSLAVFKRSTSVVQLLISADGHKIYTRGYSSSAFTAWQKVGMNTISTKQITTQYGYIYAIKNDRIVNLAWGGLSDVALPNDTELVAATTALIPYGTSSQVFDVGFPVNKRGAIRVTGAGELIATGFNDGALTNTAGAITYISNNDTPLT